MKTLLSISHTEVKEPGRFCEYIVVAHHVDHFRHDRGVCFKFQVGTKTKTCDAASSFAVFVVDSLLWRGCSLVSDRRV